MDQALVTAIVEAAVKRLVEENIALLELGVNEQAVAHHLARYMQDSLSSSPLSVDVEYNKHGNEKKVLLLPLKGAAHADPIPTIVRPDIVVHTRGTDAMNVLVLEVKKPGEDLAHDRAKLQALREQYGYLYAAHVVVGYVNGQVVREILWVVG